MERAQAVAGLTDKMVRRDEHMRGVMLIGVNQAEFSEAGLGKTEGYLRELY